MADSIENVMKNIHLLFAKCQPAAGEEDMIAVPKSKVFALLEELNYAVYDVMEQYSANRNKSDMELKRKRDEGERIIREASDSAEDIYAASIVYTDRMLADVKGIIETAKMDLYKEYESFAAMLDEQLKLVGEDQNELRDQLVRMAHSRKYLRLIDELNAEEKRREELEAEEEGYDEINDDADFSYEGTEINVPDTVKNKKDSNKKGGKKNKGKNNTSATISGNNTKDNTGKNGSKMMEDDFVEKKESRTVRKVASVTDSAVTEGKGFYNDEVKHVSYEIKVNPNYNGIGVSTEELDAEYYQWMENAEDASDNLNYRDGQAAAKASKDGKEADNDKKRTKKPGFLSRLKK